jgi:prolyl 4-hydroxylase
MHHAHASTNYPWLPHNVDPSIETPEEYKDMPIQPLGDMEKKHADYMQGCVDFYTESGGPKKGKRCLDNERDRIDMSFRQPASMRNYTELGYTKIRAPAHVFKLIQEFWEANKGKEKMERWPQGNIYTNHWDYPSEIVSVEDPQMVGGGSVLKQHIWNAARDTISEWTGQALAECSLYGIRVYKEGSILATHVDRLPLVSSAIINVDQDVDEPWPLEVIGHDGIARNITMLPGDLVLYESHSILHGRPFPLKGRFMANVFIHFEPVGPVNGKMDYNGDLPPYLIEGSSEESRWRAQHPNGHTIMKSSNDFATGSTDAHRYANAGDSASLRRVLDANPALVNVRDANGWMPLHEAVRTGDLNMIQLLIDRGAEINARMGMREEGGSPLDWARKSYGKGHEIVTLIESHGGEYFLDRPHSEL